MKHSLGDMLIDWLSHSHKPVIGDIIWFVAHDTCCGMHCAEAGSKNRFGSHSEQSWPLVHDRQYRGHGLHTFCSRKDPGKHLKQVFSKGTENSSQTQLLLSISRVWLPSQTGTTGSISSGVRVSVFVVLGVGIGNSTPVDSPD